MVPPAAAPQPLRLRWSARSLAWFARAAAHSDYHEQLATRILELFPGMDSACDLGAGAGELSLTLAARGVRVTAMELEVAAAEHLRQRAQQLELARRVCPLACDWTQPAALPPELARQGHDVAVLSYCGGVREHWPRLCTLSRRGMIILCATGEAGPPFGLPGLPLFRRGHRHETAPRVRQHLKEYGVNFTEERFSAELGQPLENEADLDDFLRHYFGDRAETMRAPARALCRPLPDGGLYLPRTRESALFCVVTPPPAP